MFINDYYNSGYCGYFISGYWWLLKVIILVAIGGYCIINYCWLLHVILQVLDILCYNIVNY